MFNQHAPVIGLSEKASDTDWHLVSSLLNCSTALFWLKQICYNKGAGEDEERDRFEFAGSKIEQLPIPSPLGEILRGRPNPTAERLPTLSQACWERGQQMPGLAVKKLFEKPGETYYEWNSSLPGYVSPYQRLGKPFETAEHLKDAFAKASTRRDHFRAEMIALQEEMDWIVYAMYGLIPMDHPTVVALDIKADPNERVHPLAREERPFALWAQAAGDFEKAVTLIPSDWIGERRALWRARLELLRDNEHVRRIEQPAYKRRWDEQWKVGNRWQCGPVAYDAELIDAFDWWLSEKAEWWLERKARGGPTDLMEWTAAMSADTCVQAAWAIVSDALQRLGRFRSFDRYFRDLVKDQSVPDDIPWAVPWEELEKGRKILPSVKRIRGKLNVPRERFRTTTGGQFIWAGRELAKGTET